MKRPWPLYSWMSLNSANLKNQRVWIWNWRLGLAVDLDVIIASSVPIRWFRVYSTCQVLCLMCPVDYIGLP